MKHRYPLAILAVGLLLLGAACGKKVANNNSDDSLNNKNETENLNIANTNEDDTLNTNESENQNENENVNDDSNTNSDDDSDANTNSDDTSNANSNTNSDDNNDITSGTLTVKNPEKNDDLESPFEVRGTSSAATVYVRVKSANGTTIFTVPVTVRSGEFKVNLTYEFTNTAVGSVEVFEKDANGAEQNLVNVPVTFKVEADDDSNSNSNSNTNDD